MEIYKKFLALAKERFSAKSYVKIKEAMRIAITKTDGMTRYDGTPFAFHAIGVAQIVAEELGMGMVSAVSAILHDVVRLGFLSIDEANERFGENVTEVLRGMTNISGVETKTSTDQIEHFKELIVSYSTNPRIILLKLADRTEVMRSLESFPEEKRAKKSWESLHLYSQLAHKLGLYRIKSEMEDLSLRYLEPTDYKSIREKLQKTAPERENFIEKFIAPIKNRLEADKINFSIKGRTKSIYSIWRKMRKQHVTFEEVYDVFAIRIIIDCPREQEKSICWHAYSIVTDFNKPNPERMRDWISIPKSNGYESLHATVVTNEGKWVEVQIRSQRMDEVAERGIAAHWRYKGVEEVRSGSEQWLSQLREMMETVAVEDDVLNFNMDISSAGKEIFAFTPNGDIRKLPEGATLLDFAYDIHSDLGNKCVSGKVNHKNVSIREVLHNGDLVEISTLKNQKPKADWLSFVVTSKARSRIKVFLREESAKMANLAREELERKVKNWKINLGLEESVNILTKHFHLKSGMEVYTLIIQEKLQMSEIKDILTQYISPDEKPAPEAIVPLPEKRERKGKAKSDYLVIDERLRDVDYKLAKCCAPLYGDEIFAFVTVMKGITIHREDCVNGAALKEKFPYRVLPAAWSDNKAEGMYSIARVAISCDDVIGLDGSIRDAMKELRITLRGLSLEYSDNGVNGTVTVEVSSNSMLDWVVYRLLKIKGINKAYRVK